MDTGDVGCVREREIHANYVVRNQILCKDCTLYTEQGERQKRKRTRKGV